MNGREQESVKDRQIEEEEEEEEEEEKKSPQNLRLDSIRKQNENFGNVQKNITFINYLI